MYTTGADMAKITLDDITSGYASVTQLNARLQQVEDELNNKVLYRDNPVGEPNTVQNDIDYNGNSILNANIINAQSITIAGLDAGTIEFQGNYFVGTSASGAIAGDLWYNTTLNKVGYFNGSVWIYFEDEATNAAASAAAALISEGNASASEVAAAISAAAALVSQNAAALSEANAATSETNAGISAASALAAYDDFDDRYLGPKAVDPTLDNDGDPLVTGALYFDTTISSMKVYNGTTWDLAVEIITGGTGSVKTPKGGTGGRDTTPEAGFFRFNTDTANFEGYDGTVWTEIIDGTDLGVLAAGISTTNTFTISQIGTVTTDNDLSFDMAVTNNFKCTPTGTGTLTFTNITAGQSGNIWLDNSGGHVISAAASTYISSADLTTISTAGVYFLSYYSDGTNVLVASSPALTSTGA